MWLGARTYGPTMLIIQVLLLTHCISERNKVDKTLLYEATVLKYNLCVVFYERGRKLNSQYCYSLKGNDFH